jgi:diaminohydroxyphosphoribosylaminopyrimidine deaminase/5-amino-6-(5-phosphoribosylamino)uracil reductase
MYVTLEPCAHHGRTPPCVYRILQSGVSRVVVTTLDPDPRVYGRGVRALRDAGVQVDVGCLHALAASQNLGYYRNRLGLPQTVTLKMAATVDGKIARAPGRRDDITGEAARRVVHAMRALHDCVVVGVDTVLVDNPRLDCRFADTDPSQPLPTPVPVVLDTTLRLPAGNRWAVEERHYVVITGPKASIQRQKEIERTGARVLRCDTGRGGVSIRGALDLLRSEGYERVLVEGGARAFTSFLHSGCWDALYLFQSMKLFGEGAVPLTRGGGGDVIDGVLVDSVDVGGDMLHRFLSARSWDAVVNQVVPANKGG